MVKYADAVRLRIPELLEEAGLTPYHLSKQSGGRISLSTAYRLVRLQGRVRRFEADMLEVLCDVLEIKEPGKLFELEGHKATKQKKGRKG
jgi:DNA-binding Xre family transcriptional regulator